MRATEDNAKKGIGLSDIIAQARHYSPLKTAVVDAQEIHVLEGMLAADYFVHHTQRAIASLAGAMGGIDALVFTGGIGEHSATIRERICHAAAWLGIELDSAANLDNKIRISMTASPVSVCASYGTRHDVSDSFSPTTRAQPFTFPTWACFPLSAASKPSSPLAQPLSWPSVRAITEMPS